MLTYEEFLKNLERVQAQIAEVCKRCGRKGVQLLPVTKVHPAGYIEYVARAGLRAIGENKVQEAVEKKAALGDLPIKWELIGHLQSNKVRQAVECFDRIQSVDRVKLLHKIDTVAGERGESMRILLQVNAGEDPAKFGFECREVGAVLDEALELKHIQVEGLMTIAALDNNAEVARRAFNRLRELRDDLAQTRGIGLQELSMGMSGDMVEAIESGSTQVRVGSALFGVRNYH